MLTLLAVVVGWVFFRAADVNTALAMLDSMFLGSSGGVLLPDPSALEAAAIALGRVGEKAFTAVSALLKALGEDDPHLRTAAATALGRIGSKTRSALTWLDRLAAKDASVAVREAAKKAAAAIRDEG